jgi:predicted nucleic acid-binding protein
MVLTFVDASVLIAAARGVAPTTQAADVILTDPSRQIVSSDFVRLEVLPKPMYFSKSAEILYYQRYFSAVHLWVAPTLPLVRQAFHIAASHGLSAVDALHMAAAEIAGAAEFVTAERATSPLFRVTSLRIVSIRP